MKNSKLIFSPDGKILFHWFKAVKSFWEVGEALLPESAETFTDVWDVGNRRLLYTVPGYIVGVSEDSRTFLTQQGENTFILREITTGGRLLLEKSFSESYTLYQRTTIFFHKSQLFVKDIFGIYPPQEISKSDSLTNIVLGPCLFMTMEFDFGDGIEGAYGQAINFQENEVVFTFSVNRHAVQVPINFSTVHNILFIGINFKSYDLTTGQDLDNHVTKAIDRTLRAVGKQVHGITFHPDGKRMAVSLSEIAVEIRDITTGKKIISLSKQKAA